MRKDLGKLRRAAGIGAIAFVTAAAGFTVAAAPAFAVGTDRYVSTTGNDTDNDCTVQSKPCRHIDYAVNDVADNNDIIHVAAGTYDEAEIGIDINLTIVGATNGTTTVNGQGEGIFGAFGTNTEGGAFAPTVTFENLDISGNREGEGVLVETADVHFVNSHVDNNAYGGVIASDSTVEATGSTFNANGLSGEASNPFEGSGLFLSLSAATVDHSTFDGNFASGVLVLPEDIFNLAGTVRPNAANDFPGSVKLDHSTVSNNAFGGVLGLFSSIEVSTSTISGNTGAGVYNAAGIAGVENSTVTNTKAFPGATTESPSAGIISESPNVVSGIAPAKARAAAAARIQRFIPSTAAKSSPKISRRIAAAALPADLANGQTAVSGSIVAAQNSGLADCSGTTVDGGYNDSSDKANSCKFSTAKHDLVKTDPKIGKLADNGGATKTHAPLKGSPVIDVVPSGSAGCDKAATDQRDLARVQPVAGKCDIGSVELAAKALLIHPATLPNGTVGEKYSATVTATGGQFPSYTFALESGTLPPGLSFAANGKLAGTPTKAGTFTFTVSVNDPVLKTYTVVIEDASTNGNGDRIANTGSHTGSMVAVGAGALFAGFLLMLGAGAIGKRQARSRNSES